MGYFFLFLVVLSLLGCSGPAPDAGEAISVQQAMSDISGEDAGFARALEPRAFSFPGDHGPHPEFKHEWWYFTGNLADESGSGRRFGYQVTFFRIGLAADGAPRRSRWATQQVWMAHVALSDIRAGEHHARERLVRGTLGLAGTRLKPLRVWVESWSLSRQEDSGPWRLEIGTDAFSLDLELNALRSPALQGDQGLSQKNAEPGNASYYYSIPRLETRGELTIQDQAYQVQGLSWLDREWSTSALGPDQAGWDWFSMQLDDGTDIMFYRLRRKDGRPDPHNRGSAQLSDGTHVDLLPEEVELRPLKWWESKDGRRYPIVWEFYAQRLQRRIRVQALIPDQQMDLSVRYWEGAVELLDSGDSGHLGYGYLEMTGY